MSKPGNKNLSAKQTESRCQCPFCDEVMEKPYPFCQICGAKIERCPKCGAVLVPDKPHLCRD